MARFALVCAAALSLAALGACAREPDPARQDAPVNDAAAPPPPLTTEMVGGSDPAVQPAVAPTTAPAAAPQGTATTPAAPTAAPTAAPATAPAADTSHAAHADSGHTGGH
jgi:hypothetical protein